MRLLDNRFIGKVTDESITDLVDKVNAALLLVVLPQRAVAVELPAGTMMMSEQLPGV